MHTSKFECDDCGKDLSTTHNCEDWRLSLHVESIPNPHPTATLMHIARPISRTYHFCGMTCLQKAVNERKVR